ncbi:MAG: hypothetical protein ACREXP_27170, partial [Steroidobacteraceae bacterium]
MKKTQFAKDRNLDLDKQALESARRLDEVLVTAAQAFFRCSSDLRQVHPAVARAVTGVAGSEGLAEFAIERFNVRRFDYSDESAPSIEKRLRDALAERDIA